MKSTMSRLFACGFFLVASRILLRAQDAKAGQDIFLKYTCYGCHGFSGQNGPGARLVPMRMTQSGFVNYVRSPRTRQMPSYSTKVLSDTQLGDVYAYHKTFPAPRAARA